MGQLGSVDLDFGIKGFDVITKAFTWMDSMGKKIQGTMSSVEKPFENMQKTFENNLESIKTINKEFSEQNKKLRDVNSAMEVFGDNDIVSFFEKLNSRVLSFGQQARVLNEVGGVTGLIKMQFVQLSNTMTMAFGPGMKAQLFGLISVFSSILPWIVVIGAAVGLMFKIWENNIGNIQGLWIIFTGRIQRAWAVFDLQLRKSLIKLGPLFSGVFKPLFTFVGGFVEGVITMFTEMLWVMGVVGNLLGPVVRLFENLFGVGNRTNSVFNDMGIWVGRIAAIGIVVLVVTKIIAGLATVLGILKGVFLAVGAAFAVSNPIGWIVIGVVALIAGIVLLIKYFKEIKNFLSKIPDPFILMISPLALLIKYSDVIVEKFQMIWEFIKNMIEAISKVADFFNKDKKTIDIEANVKPVQSGNTNNINNNTNVSVYSSGPMNPASAYRTGEGFATGINKYNMSGG